MLSAERQFWFRRDFTLQHGSAQSEDKLQNHDKWSLITNKILSRDINLHIFHDENILLLAFVSQYVERIFLWTAIVMVTVYIKSLIHFPLKSLERLIQYNPAPAFSTFFRLQNETLPSEESFESTSFFFPFEINFITDEIFEQRCYLHPHNNLFKNRFYGFRL